MTCDSEEALYHNYQWIKWYKLTKNSEGNFIEETVIDAKHRIDEEGNLWFLYVSLEDDSNFKGYASPYYCTYISPTFAESYNGSQIFIKVIDNNDSVETAITPLYISPNKIVATIGTPNNLYCIHGGDNLSIQWIINGEENSDYDNHDIIYNSYFESNEAGLYSCYVTNNITFMSHDFRVVLDTKPTWQEYQYHVEEPEEGEASFLCITNEDDITQHEWFINAVPIADANLDDRWIITPNKITVKNLKPSDISIIGCKATVNNISIYDENILFVRWNAPQFAVKNVTEVTLFINDSGLLISQYVSGPIPTLKCIKNGIEIQSNSRLNISSTSLYITNARAEDAGVYECTASNKYGSDTIKKVLKIYKRPNFYTNIRKFTTKVGETVVLDCIVDNNYNPDLEFIWKFQHAELILDDNHVVNSNKSLTIKNIDISDDGLYYCRAGKNNVYAFSENIYLTVN